MEIYEISHYCMILLQCLLYGLTLWLEVIVILEWTPPIQMGGVVLHLLNIGKGFLRLFQYFNFYVSYVPNFFY